MGQDDLPARSLGEVVADQIRAAILSGEYGPGQRLVERTLAEQFGTSHIPVREALTTLAEEGVIERLPRRGARVVALTRRDLDEISSLRTLLEEFVVARAQQHWSPERESELREIAAAMIAAADQGDTAPLFELDQRFHELLWEFADHDILLSVTSQLRNRISGFLIAANRALTPDAQLTHARSHGELIDAIASGDRARAQAAMAEHIHAAKDRIAEALLPDDDA